MSQIQEPTTTEIMGKVVEAVVAVQDAEKTVIDEGQRLVRHMLDPDAHGAGTAESIIAAMPKPVWEGSKLGFTNDSGTLQVPATELRGPAGLPPSHLWSGSALRFQKPDGLWGEPVDLKGPKGDPGTSNTPLSSSVTSESEEDAATSLAVKTAYDKAQEALQTAQANNSWGGLSGKPDTFPPSGHAASHAHDGPDALRAESIGALPVDGNAVSASAVPWGGVSDKPSAFPASAHAASHGAGGSDRLTPADIGALPAGGKAASANVADSANAVEWANVSGKPARFPVANHASAHAAGGSDAITPASIGAAAASHTTPAASTTVVGHVKLSTAINSTATNLAATPSAVKTAYDKAVAAASAASSAQTVVGKKAPLPQAAAGVGQWGRIDSVKESMPVFGGDGSVYALYLPSGGTWAYIAVQGVALYAGVAAGGIKLLRGNYSNGLAWRIA